MNNVLDKKKKRTRQHQAAHGATQKRLAKWEPLTAPQTKRKRAE
jgi:hypothetical protein